MLQSIRGDQLYHNLSHGQMLIGAYTRQNVTVTQQDYISEYDLRKIAQQNGTARTRVRFRIEEDPATGKMISRSYEVGERSGLDRVRVRFAEQVSDNMWQFEDTLSGVTLLWSRSAGEGRFEWGAVRPLSMTVTLAAIPRRRHLFRNLGASGDYPTRPPNRYPRTGNADPRGAEAKY